MSEELYQELILAHSKTPSNFGKLEGDCERCHMQNPLCGDEIDFYIRFDGDQVVECRFEGVGCSISKAAASILSEEIRGKHIPEIETIISSYHQLLTDSVKKCNDNDCEHCEFGQECLGDLVVFSGVKRYPTRIRCATLAVEALAKLIEKQKSLPLTILPHAR